MFIFWDKFRCFSFKFRVVQKKHITFCDMPNIIHMSYPGLFELHVRLDLIIKSGFIFSLCWLLICDSLQFIMKAKKRRGSSEMYMKRNWYCKCWIYIIVEYIFMTRKVWDVHSEVYVNPFKTIQNVLLSSSAWSKLSMSCVFSLPLETSLTALARHLVKVLTSYSHFFWPGQDGS